MLTGPSSPKIIAHRGACLRAPENTLPAFQMAVEEGADGFELDAKLTRDGEVVVMHDATVDRTTDGSGAVSEFTLAAFKRLDAGKKFSPTTGSIHPPTLQEVFENTDAHAIINVELTDYQHPMNRLVERVVETVERCGMENRVFFSSFLPGRLTRVRQLMPEASCALLAMGGIPGELAKTANACLRNPWFNPYWTLITDEMIERARKRSQKLMVWTVNDPDEATRLVQRGVMGLITDDPAVLVQVLRAG
ncbi:MAG: glycerophosphodiester phosphodiesterase family protein [Anaerolineaceae bacterium]